MAPKIGNLSKRQSGQGKDQLLFDLGLDHKSLDNVAKVTRKIKEIDNSFDLVMIAENFSQSLVLLKKELCWDTQDLTSFQLNGRKKESKSELNQTTRGLLKDYLKSDYMLYDHFYQIFHSKLEKFGKARMASEVSALEEANKEIAAACSIVETKNGKLKGDQKWYGPGNLIGYTVQNSTNERCLLMTMPGLTYIGRIREKQTEIANRTLENMDKVGKFK